jgi:hypothetical protein
VIAPINRQLFPLRRSGNTATIKGTRIGRKSPASRGESTAGKKRCSRNRCSLYLLGPTGLFVKRNAADDHRAGKEKIKCSGIGPSFAGCCDVPS